VRPHRTRPEPVSLSRQYDHADRTGDIVFDETVSLDGHPFPEPWPIISGTGEFLGATGSVESPDDSTWSWGDFVITITG
jgi:hypothetical protein